MEYSEKIVKFDVYCPKFKNKDTNEHDNPCDECLLSPTNTNTSEPINFKEK